MANTIEYTNIDPVANYLVSASSRYTNSKVIYYGKNRYLTFTTYHRRKQEARSDDQYAVISAGTEYRPDLVSQQVYGVPDFWFRIMEAKTGVNIVIPQVIL